MPIFSASTVYPFQPPVLIRDSYGDGAALHEIALAARSPVLGKALANLMSKSHNLRTVAERRGVIAGFTIYTYEPGLLSVQVLAVRPSCQHKGVARLLLDDLKTRLDLRHPRLSYEVEEHCDPTIRFLSHCGMHAVRPVLRDRFGTGRDGYRFVWPNVTS